jgi:hypothetical protein
MHVSGASQVTLGLLILLGLFVIYTRFKNWLQSNVPIFFYILLFVYMQNDGSVPFWLICIGFALALMLRFEFMNNGFTRFVKFLEMSTLGVMLYLSAGMLLS